MGDKNNNTGVDPWTKGDRLLAKHLSEPGDVLNRQSKVAPGSGIDEPGINRVIVRMFQVAEVGFDVIKCFAFDGETLSDEPVNVAMPHLLQQTPYLLRAESGNNRKDLTYVYKTGSTRTATRTDDTTEEQIIIGSYEVGDVIFAMSGVTGGVNTKDSETGEPILWMDLNIEGRFWGLDKNPVEAEE